MRLIKPVAAACAVLCACAAILLQLGPGASAAIRHIPLTYDPATQSHPGACSQSTLDVSAAVSDLSANGVLGQYASLVGVRATGAALSAQMKQALIVLKVLRTTVTANHGCTTDGIIFPSGARTLTAGETVGVALPASVRAKLCRGSAAGCERKVLTEHTVFPTNCWNLDQGSVQVAVYVHRPKVKAKPKPKPQPKPKHKHKHKPVTKAKQKLARPSASVSTACGSGSAGTSTVTLSNGAGASASAEFVVDGKSYGPLGAGASSTVTIALSSSNDTLVKVSSGGEVLVDQSIPADRCPSPPTTTTTTTTTTVPGAPAVPGAAAPTATAGLSCAAGGVVVTLSNAKTATAAASFEVNGTSYGPLAPGQSQTVTIVVAPGATQKLTVTSGATTLLSGAAYSNGCTRPSSAATVTCSQSPDSGGTLEVELVNAATASSGADFSVTATGNTTAGYGPATLGPVAPGATQTLLLPVDGSGNPVTVDVSSGSYSESFPNLTGCPSQVEAG